MAAGQDQDQEGEDVEGVGGGGAQDLTGLIVDQVSGGQGGDVLREEETWWKPHCNCPRVCTPIRWR
jgi:hypothetical protein